MRDIKYRKQGYVIMKTSGNSTNGKKYIVFRDGDFKRHHTHVSTVDIGKTMIHLVVNCKSPRSNNIEFLKSLIRLSNNKNYIEKIENKLKNN